MLHQHTAIGDHVYIVMIRGCIRYLNSMARPALIIIVKHFTNIWKGPHSAGNMLCGSSAGSDLRCKKTFFTKVNANIYRELGEALF